MMTISMETIITALAYNNIRLPASTHITSARTIQHMKETRYSAHKLQLQRLQTGDPTSMLMPKLQTPTLLIVIIYMSEVAPTNYAILP